MSAEYPTYRPAVGPDLNDPRRIPPRGLAVGQRVIAQFGQYGSTPQLGVITQVNRFDDGYAVQFEPCGCHFHVGMRVSAFGDANGWTNREYRVARELSSSRDHALAVERERRQRHPSAPATLVSSALALLDDDNSLIG